MLKYISVSNEANEPSSETLKGPHCPYFTVSQTTYFSWFLKIISQQLQATETSFCMEARAGMHGGLRACMFLRLFSGRRMMGMEALAMSSRFLAEVRCDAASHPRSGL